MLPSRIVVGRADRSGMASSQDIRLTATLAALKLTLSPVLVEFGTIVPLPLGICQHHDPIHSMECWGRSSFTYDAHTSRRRIQRSQKKFC